jgi:hypothetical protein
VRGVYDHHNYVEHTGPALLELEAEISSICCLKQERAEINSIGRLLSKADQKQAGIEELKQAAHGLRNLLEQLNRKSWSSDCAKAWGQGR